MVVICLCGCRTTTFVGNALGGGALGVVGGGNNLIFGGASCNDFEGAYLFLYLIYIA